MGGGGVSVGGEGSAWEGEGSAWEEVGWRWCVVGTWYSTLDSLMAVGRELSSCLSVEPCIPPSLETAHRGHMAQ